MTLWQKNGGAPQALPREDRGDDGFIWTELAANAHGREQCGWTEAPEPPSHDPAAEQVVWIDGAWDVQPLPPPAVVRRVSRIEFLQSMPAAKRIAVRQAGKTDMIIEDFLDLLSAAENGVELDHADTVAGLGYLESQGLLTAEDVAAIRA